MTRRRTLEVSSNQRFRVFDFAAEDQRIQGESEKILGRYGIAKRKRNLSSPVTKYKFLQSFAGLIGDSDKGNINQPINVDDGGTRASEKENSNQPINVDDDGTGASENAISNQPIDVDDGYAGVLEKVSSNQPVNVYDGCTGVLENESSNKPINVDDECNGVSGKENINQLIDVDDGQIDVNVGVAGRTKALFEGICDRIVDIDANSYHHTSTLSPMHMTQKDVTVRGEIFELDELVLSSSSNYENEPVAIMSDDDDRIQMSFSSTLVSTLAENEAQLVEKVPEFSSIGHEIDYLNKTVVVFPDFILYGDIYSTESRLIFSNSCIHVEGSTINGTKGVLDAKWSIDDITNIESEWCGRVETAMIYIHLKRKVSEEAGNANETSDTDVLKVSIYDPHWSEGQEAIKSLDVRYKHIWIAIFGTNGDKSGKGFSMHRSMVSKLYFPILEESFEDVIYPKGDPDAVSISKRDLELLQPETFINDTIIDFYIKYLKSKIQLEDQQRFHFFNSFFFRKLADLDRDPSNTCEGKAAFQRVRKWTKKLNLFEKDYLFIPVNYSLHWSLIVICHPGEVAHFRDDESKRSERVPCILHMDSIRGSHRGLKNLVQSYLSEEWRERHNETMDDASSKFLDMLFVPLELPQQENSFDCGLFLLHYVELFLENAPVNFSPFKITKFSNFLNRNWFPPEEASLKRVHIQRLIYEILEDQTYKGSSVDFTKMYPSSQYPDTNEQENGVEFLEERLSPQKCHSYFSRPNCELGFGISPSMATPSSIVQQSRRSGLNSRKLFEPGSSATAISNVNKWHIGALHGGSSMSPIQEVDETGGYVSDSSDPESCWQVAKFAAKYPRTFSCNNNLRSFGTSQEHKYMDLVELDDDDNDDGYNSSCSDTSINGSQKSSEIGGDEYYIDPELMGCDHPKEDSKQEVSSTSSEDLAACVVEDTQESNCSHDDTVGKDSSPSSTEDIFKENKVPISNCNMVSEPDEKAAKGLRLASTVRNSSQE